MNVMLIGSADLSGKKIGGQYEKTRLVYNFLKAEEGVKVYFCNMFDIGRTVRLFMAVSKGYMSNDCVVVITSTRGTKIISRLLYLLRKVKKKIIVYLVVGNQQNLLKSLPDTIAGSIDKLYLEVSSMQEELSDRYNVGFFSNCKDIHLFEFGHPAVEPIKICYYSEISYRKGFDRLIRALDVINENKVLYELDAYGFFADDEADMKKYFDTREYLKFKGVVKREKSRESLSQYCFMVFPSRHKLEGVPGAIVDAYEAGLPVICSDVGFLPQVVKHRETGQIFHSEDDLIGCLAMILKNPDMINRMRVNCLKEAQKYDIKQSIKVLHDDLDAMVGTYG